MNAEQILKEMTLEEKAAFCSGRDFWHTKAVERLNVPSVMMCDGPHGLRKQEGEGDHLGINKSIETVCYPTAAALASSFDRDVMRRLGEALGQECRAENVAMLLGPGLNIKRSPLCGRNFEYFSEDPYLAGEMGAAYVQALQSKGVAACAKHFACNNQETRRMSGSSNLDERTLHEIYLPAFEAVVKKGRTRSLMCAYNAVNGEFCAENKMLLTDILREKWGFDGFVVTDWGAVKDRAKGVSSGLDLEMPGGPNATGEELLEALKKGELAEADLDKAVLNLLRFVETAVRQRDENAVIDRDACRRLARQLAGECAVLMKNENLLPLKEGQKVAFIGEFADKPRYQGAGSSHINVPHPVSALEAAGDAVIYVRGCDVHSDRTDEKLLKEAVKTAKDAEIAVIFAGLPDAFESEGADRDHMHLPDNQNELIKAVAAVNPNTVVVLHGGSPVELPWLSQVPAVLCMYLGGEQVGAAAVDLLYGRVNPSGHLAETWPVRLQDNPSYLNFPGEDGVVTYAEGIFVGYRYYDKKELAVNFPFGHGLSYTSFAFSNLIVDKEKLTDQETVTVSVDVTNTGKIAGKAVIQLYVHDVKSTVRRPLRELRDFAKTELQPGETKTLFFTLDKRSFAYYEPKVHDFFVESGEFMIEVGESCRDIRRSVSIHVEGTTPLSFTIDANTTIGQLMKHPRGAAFIRQMMGRSDGPSGSEQAEAMGEGSEKIMQQMMFDMPLGSLVSYGRMTGRQLKDLIVSLNA
ncbi:MAG: glycoside hydrolase family 3 C-terminal domain-containing protein [Lachnospiraceae bacterium]|nr:glycoside hydrolase family 3 C-terminal domain-containing protein [Lachnospiraceae bacterium]